ncbi:hypothetical protein NPIL_396901 [Nephila pilipes]|uniref:Uncharacterized protein n=1 Tax=Nephila pilipes TaxID=299642 RepID=A0A8X6UQD9_NEPPI|nr:hypothetical protein NPIL_112281 [Nephila pilipes]GFT45898.1 hypothetical protein NPIL_50861 [Nephila pilipes]GFT65271.1 hypothetical protein NPIL_701711 [Nephila pilipes]GFU37289.1 hypothetical protein NPIL_396901 [Nephila pilipes]
MRTIFFNDNFSNWRRRWSCNNRPLFTHIVHYRFGVGGLSVCLWLEASGPTYTHDACTSVLQELEYIQTILFDSSMCEMTLCHATIESTVGFKISRFSPSSSGLRPAGEWSTFGPRRS